MSSILDINVSQIIYNYAFTIGGTALVLWAIFKFGVHKAADELMERIDAKLDPLTEDVQRIKYQVFNNGGESMKDSIDRTERDVTELKINQARIMALLEAKKTRSK